MIWRSKIVHGIINRTPIKKLLTANRFFVRAYFNFLYRRQDPYRAFRDEEKKKYEEAFRLVEGFKAEKALEIGCGEGAWSHYVAAIAEKAVAVDISDAAIKKAKKRNRHNPGIEYRRADLVTDDFSGQTYDFIFCGEVLYYLELRQFNKIVPQIINLMNSNGKLLLVHIRSLGDDSSGLELKEFGAKTIHEAFIRHPSLELEGDLIDKSYRITLLHRN